MPIDSELGDRISNFIHVDRDDLHDIAEAAFLLLGRLLVLTFFKGSLTPVSKNQVETADVPSAT